MWLILGFLIGAGSILLISWLRSRKIKTTWYHWAIAALGLLLVLFAAENARVSSSEFEHIATAKTLLVFGLPGIVLIALSAALLWWKTKSAKS